MKHHLSTRELRERAKRVETINEGRAPVMPDVPIVARPLRRYRGRLFQGYLIAATIIFGGLLYLARSVAYFEFDLRVARWVQEQQNFGLDVALAAVSELGFNPLAAWFVCLTIVFVYLVGLKWEAIMLFAGSAGIGLLNVGVKFFVQRQRPSPELVNVVSLLEDYSFPSGHVLLFTAFLGFVMFLVYTLAPQSGLRWVGLTLLGTLIALVGLSRVYLGHHWPSDVIAAYLLGSLWLTVTVFVYRKGKPRALARQHLRRAHLNGDAQTAR